MNPKPCPQVLAVPQKGGYDLVCTPPGHVRDGTLRFSARAMFFPLKPTGGLRAQIPAEEARERQRLERTWSQVSRATFLPFPAPSVLF